MVSRLRMCMGLWIVMTLMLLSAPALATERIEGPKSVRQGEPFYVRLLSERELSDVELHWGKMTSRPQVEKKSWGYQALVMFGTDCQAKAGTGAVRAVFKSNGQPRELKRSVAIKARKFAEQRLTVAKKMVHLSQKALDRHYGEKKKIREVLDHSDSERRWSGWFVRPVPGEISSIYGLRRFFNNEPRAPHRGVDFRGAKGTPVKAVARGRVALVGDHYFSGNSVYLDHGQGVLSMYFHLSAIQVKVGDVVDAGTVIGKVGSTGRVTGPHLHLSLSVHGELVDPMPLLTGTITP